MNLLYRIGWLLSRAVLFTWCRVRIYGEENIPATGGVLLCANHIHNLDPPMLGAAIHRPIAFMAKESLFRVPILGYLVRKVGAFPVQRGAADRAALRTSLQILEEGKVFGIFPEGTRSKTGELGRAHAGVAFIALRSKAAVVPVGISGGYGFQRKLTIRIGKPLDLALAADADGKLDRDQVTDYIMQTVAALAESTPEPKR